MGAYTNANLPSVANDITWTPELWDLEVRRQALPLYTFRQFAKDVRSAWGDSDTISAIKRNDIATAGGTLVAGTTIPRNTFTVGTVTYTPAEYGNAISPETRLFRLSPWALQRELSDVLARDAAKVIDEAVRAVLVAGIAAGTNCFCMGAGGTTVGTTKPSGTVGTATYRLTAYGVWAAVDYLASQNAPMLKRPGMPEGYIGILHPYQARGIKRDSNFVNVVQYATDGSRIFNNEIGFWEGVYWIQTTQGIKQADNGNYGALIMGDGVFGEYTVTDVSVRRDPDTDFGRQQNWAWYADLGWTVEWPNYMACIYSLTGSPA
jgi:N4-gp56 family major capsid protein